MGSVHSLLELPVLFLLRILLSGLIPGLDNSVKGVSFTGFATKWHHPVNRIEDIALKNLGVSNDDYFRDFNHTLDNILIQRVPGTPTHAQVRQYILREMNALGWMVEQDQFQDRTPYGKRDFANIIATADPTACRRLVIACHYDSLHNREYTFVGATDSAVPCAMMIHAAKLLNPLIQKQKEKMKVRNQITLQLIFFDGEEAFKRWSPTDSLYGSRHLADKFNRMKPFTSKGDMNTADGCADRQYVSYLDQIDVMILLDLIGSANPKFYSYFPQTEKLYSELVDIEHRLNSLKLVEAHPPEYKTSYFENRAMFAFVEDDHVPFMKKDVPIIHLIPSPFPVVWHRESDNRANLHHPTIDNLNKILRVFIAEYLHLDVPQKLFLM